jgi:hypothetical protein
MVRFFSRVLPAVVALAPLTHAACVGRAENGTTGDGFLTTPTGPVGGQSVRNTVLILARDSAGSEEAARGLRGYGIPFETVIVPKEGTTLPMLNSTATSGNYGGIVIVSETTYDYGASGWLSALTATQFTTLYNYQVAFGVRMVRIDAFPNPDFGTTVASGGSGCCATDVEQLISFSNNTGFATANVKTNAGVTTKGLWHYPATITSPSTTWEIAKFGPSGAFTTDSTAAVINDINGRQQMVFFISWASDWSATTNYLQHAWVHWMTRGLFVGKRKTYLNCQVDDVGLSTGLYHPNDTEFKIRTGDLDAHVTWQENINARMPSGSNFFLDMGHNGNGDFIAVTANDGYPSLCSPNYAVDYEYPPDTPLEFQKPLGSGDDRWPAEWVNYTWSYECAIKDDFTAWFTNPTNLNKFSHVSHTFTHQEVNNATYHDAARDIQFNQAWLAQMGIDKAANFAPHGLIPPAITGLHNGDAIKAWMDNGIWYVVGDNTRPVLKNSQNSFWPYITNVETNGYAGLVIVPRYATTIYYNCDLPDCTVLEWVVTSGGKGGWTDLLNDARATNTRYLLGLHPDPYMFHQANMRVIDTTDMTVGSETRKHSILMAWVETIAQEMYRLTNWPILSISHDALAQVFIDRMALDNCTPNLAYNYDTTGRNIVSVTVTASGNSCGVPVPVTIPGTGSVSGATSTVDKTGTEPAIHNIVLAGSPATLTLGSPVSVSA